MAYSATEISCTVGREKQALAGGIGRPLKNVRCALHQKKEVHVIECIRSKIYVSEKHFCLVNV